MNFNMRPMQVAIHPGYDLGRGASGGGFGSGFWRGIESTWNNGWAPDESGFCGPNAVMGADGLCHLIVEMGQAAPYPVPVPSGKVPATTPVPVVVQPYTIPIVGQEVPGTVLGFPTKTVVIGGAVILGAALLMKLL